MRRSTWLLVVACALAAPPAPLPAPFPAHATPAPVLSPSLEKPRKDQDSSATATGYIYRKDGNKPALFLKLGAGSADALAFEQQRYAAGLGKLDSVDPQGFLPSVDLSTQIGSPGHLDTDHISGPNHDVPHYGPGNLDSPDHFESVGGGLDEHLPLGNHGPLQGFGDTGDEYLSSLSRIKHATRAPPAVEYNDDYAATRALGEELRAGSSGEGYSPVDVHAGTHAGLQSHPGVHSHAGLHSHANYHHGLGGGHGKGHSAGGGSKHSAHHFSIHGTKAGKEHKSTKTYGAGESGAHGAAGHKGHFASAGAAKKVHHDEVGKYGSHHTDTKGSAGAKHGEKGHGKKGHKSTGFHNVYNKDEFTKDTSFYDTQDKGGHHHKGGDYASEHGGKSGNHKKGGHHGSAYDEDHKGKKVHVDKGKLSDDHKANKGSLDHESHFGNKEQYGKKEGASGGKKYGHKSGGGGHH